MTSDQEPIACTLSAQHAEAQLHEWVDLQRLVLSTAPLSTGARMTFPAAHAAAIIDLAEREAKCCTFLNITTSLDDDELAVEITSESNDAIGLIDALTGVVRS